MVQLKVASMFFFSGLAVVIALVVVVYIVAWIYDRASGSAEALLTQTELEERRVASTLVKEAGLAGLLPNEKNKVMRHFFQGHSKIYAKQHDIETPRGKFGVDRYCAKQVPRQTDDKKKSESRTKVTDSKKYPAEKDEISSSKHICEKNDVESNCCYCDEEGKNKSKQKSDERKEGSQCCCREDSNDLDQADKDAEDGVCPICLVEFENDENVIIGSSCGHMFHFECFMQWVEKNHTDCPLCRSNMMTAENFLASAYEVLGEQRVNKLKHINEEAARRLVTLEANRHEGIREESESPHDEQPSSEPVDPPVRMDPPARLAPTATADTSRLTVVMVQ